MSHPLSTANLYALAAGSGEPDHDHVEAAYHGAQALALFGEDPTDRDYEMAADVAALRMALANAAALARKVYDHPANGGPEALTDFLYRIAGHYVGQLENLMADIESLADADHAAAV